MLALTQDYLQINLIYNLFFNEKMIKGPLFATCSTLCIRLDEGAQSVMADVLLFHVYIVIRERERWGG